MSTETLTEIPTYTRNTDRFLQTKIEAGIQAGLADVVAGRCENFSPSYTKKRLVEFAARIK